MNSNTLNSRRTTAVALCVFKRPAETRQVLEALAIYAPQRLYVIADGPRNEEEAALRAETLALFQQLPWNAEIHFDLAEENLGVRRRVRSGIDWVFSQEERAIILEDDCVPHPEFFPYCEELLERHADDERIMHIGGNNFLQGWKASKDSYYFSRHTHCWGWATWRRAWRLNDADLRHWEAFEAARGMADYSNDRFEEDYFMDCVRRVATGRVSSWAYIWGYSCLLHHGLAIVPTVNLVRNIGFGENATHTRGDAWFANLETQSILPLRHPAMVVRQREADGRVFDTHFGGAEMRKAFRWDRRLRRLGPGLKRRWRKLWDK